METPVEIRYAGVVVARSNEVRHMTVGGVDLFVGMPDPLPAGTVVTLGKDHQNVQTARIEKVIESIDPSVAGVYVKLISEADAELPWSPSFREDEVPAPRPPAVVVSPVIVRPVHARVPTPATVPVPAVSTPAAPAPLPPPVEAVAPPVPPAAEPPPAPAPFTTPMPHPDEQIAHFEPVVQPPPGVVEGPVRKERSKRSTIVVAAVPPPDDAPVEAMGEIDTGSRRVREMGSEAQSASIVVESDVEESGPNAAAAEPPAEPASPAAESPRQSELRLEDLPPAKALPGRGRATRRRRTTQR